MAKLFAIYLIWRFFAFNFPLALAWWANRPEDTEKILLRRIRVYTIFVFVYSAAQFVSILPPYRRYFAEKIAGLLSAIDQHKFALRQAQNPTDFDDLDDIGDLPSSLPSKSA